MAEFRNALQLAGFLLATMPALCGQTPAVPAAAVQDPRPLPDIPTLMREVEVHERVAETAEKDYIYREATVLEKLDGGGKVKQTESRDFDVFWIDGVIVQKLVAKDGKPLSADEQKKEAERIDKVVAKERERRSKADAAGKETDPEGHEEVTLARILQLGAFSNPRRMQVDGRDTIVVDYTGDPKAKTHNQAEAAIHELGGTIWVDEADRSIIKMQAEFLHPYKIGGGLLINVKQGTSFRVQLKKVNAEVWLPESVDAEGDARLMLLFNLNGRLRVRYSDYRKFRASAKILPGVSEVDSDNPVPETKP